MRPSTITCTRSASSCTRKRLKWVMARSPDAPLGGGVLQAARHLAQRVDVEARVDLVEDADGGPEHAELDHLGALALAAREVDVERPAQQAGVEADGLGLLDHALLQRERRLGADVAHAAAGGRGQQRVQAHAGHLDRVLQREEQPGPRPLPRRQAGQLLPVHGDGARGHLGAGPAHERVGQGALARAVGAHDHVHLAAAHREVDAVQHLPAARRGVQVPDLEDVLGAHGSTTDDGAVRRPRPRRRRRAASPAASRARRSRRSNVLPWRGHSIWHSSAHTSPSDSE